MATGKSKLPEFVSATADISDCGRFRYSLTRVWQPQVRVCNFLMLNPSTADAITLDPTIRRCVGYACVWGYGGLIVTNLFAFRSTDPGVLSRKRKVDIVGERNDAEIMKAAAASQVVVCAWGVSGSMFRRDADVLRLLGDAGCPLMCLRLTNDGHPFHPLYQKASLTPTRF